MCKSHFCLLEKTFGPGWFGDGLINSNGPDILLVAVIPQEVFSAPPL